MKRGIAIRVHYVGPTNTRGSRWVATADHPIGRAVRGYVDSGLEGAQVAAQDLLDLWNKDHEKRYGVPDARSIVAGGHLPDGSYCYIVSHTVAR